jgi:hypothetical protein
MTPRHRTDTELGRQILGEEGGEAVPPDPHLKACSLCTDRRNVLRRFYDELRREMHDRPSLQVSAPADTLSSPYRLVLPPFARLKADTHGTPREGLLLHAAQTVAEARYASVATFALASTGVLARIVRDHVTGLCRISVLSEDPEHRRHVLVGVGGPQGQTPLQPTDAEGLATIDLEETDDWTARYVVVIAPAFSLPLPDGLPLSGSISCGAASISVLAMENDIRITLMPGPLERIGHAMAVLRDGSALLREVSDNGVSFPFPIAGSVTELRFFL